MALYSPRLCPATTAGFRTSRSLNVSYAAISKVRTANCVLTVWSSASLGPFRQRDRMSVPRIAWARLKMLRKGPRCSQRSPPIPTNCEPCPGKTRPILPIPHPCLPLPLHHIRPRRLFASRVFPGAQRGRLCRGEASGLQPLRPVFPPGAPPFLPAAQPPIRVRFSFRLAGPVLPSRHLRRGIHDARDVPFAGKYVPDGPVNLVADLE